MTMWDKHDWLATAHAILTGRLNVEIAQGPLLRVL
jgi:hypothetical protein